MGSRQLEGVYKKLPTCVYNSSVLCAIVLVLATHKSINSSTKIDFSRLKNVQFYPSFSLLTKCDDNKNYTVDQQHRLLKYYKEKSFQIAQVLERARRWRSSNLARVCKHKSDTFRTPLARRVSLK